MTWVNALADGTPETSLEMARLSVARPWCLAGHYLANLPLMGYPVECLSWEPLIEIRVSD